MELRLDRTKHNSMGAWYTCTVHMNSAQEVRWWVKVHKYNCRAGNGYSSIDRGAWNHPHFCSKWYVTNNINQLLSTSIKWRVRDRTSINAVGLKDLAA
jgi:hypothetical protein